MILSKQLSSSIEYSLVCASGQKESEQLQCLQSNQLTLGSHQLEDTPHSLLNVESWYHRARVFRHQRYQHLQNIVQILILVHCRQVVENALQLVLLHTVPDHYQLLQEQQNVRADRQNILLGGSRSIQSLGHDAALRTRIHHPIVELERVHGLQNGADTSHIAVDLGVAEKFCGQVRVEARLNVGRRVDPQSWVEEHVVEQLPRQKRETKELTLAVYDTVQPPARSTARACRK